MQRFSGDKRAALLIELTRIAREAGRLVMRHYADESIARRHKADKSPVTAADEEAERLIAEREGRLCVRFYQRTDGTVLTADCEVGVRRRRVRRLVTRT